jgi:DNA-binding NarL/FixJ family response regulator
MGSSVVLSSAEGSQMVRENRKLQSEFGQPKKWRPFAVFVIIDYQVLRESRIKMLRPEKINVRGNMTAMDFIADSLNHFTTRELNVLDMPIETDSSRDIGNQLGFSARPVETPRGRISNRMRVDDLSHFSYRSHGQGTIAPSVLQRKQPHE